MSRLLALHTSLAGRTDVVVLRVCAVPVMTYEVDLYLGSRMARFIIVDSGTSWCVLQRDVSGAGMTFDNLHDWVHSLQP